MEKHSYILPVSFSKCSDAELKVFLYKGEELAYRELYARYSPVLLTYAYKLLEDKDDAEDLIQELFISLWNKRVGLEIKSSLAAYLYTAVRNRAMSFFRHKKVYHSYLKSLADFKDSGEFKTDNDLRFKELSALLEEAMAGLPKKMRRVFELSRLDNLSQKAIALELGITETTVKKQSQNAMKFIRTKLGNLYSFLF